MSYDLSLYKFGLNLLLEGYLHVFFTLTQLNTPYNAMINNTTKNWVTTFVLVKQTNNITENQIILFFVFI